MTEINKVNADGTFLLDKTSKKLLKIQQHSFAKQLGDRGMKLPNLARSAPRALTHPVQREREQTAFVRERR